MNCLFNSFRRNEISTEARERWSGGTCGATSGEHNLGPCGEEKGTSAMEKLGASATSLGPYINCLYVLVSVLPDEYWNNNLAVVVTDRLLIYSPLLIMSHLRLAISVYLKNQSLLNRSRYCSLWKPKVHQGVHKSSPLETILAT
jgi:hypothetical protein